MGERLKDKVAVVVGAGSVGEGWGNGKATAVLFAREGASIFAVDINRDAAAVTAGIIAAEGGVCEIDAADVTRSESVRGMIERCVERFGRIDVLVNNVGIVVAGGPVEQSEADWDRVLDTNLKSMFLTAKHAIPVMERTGGSIVNVSSVAGVRWLGAPYISYAASKAAVNQFTEVLAMQYARKRIRVNAVLPGLMNTPMIVEPLKGFYGGDVEAMIKARNEMTPTGAMGDAWDVAYAALYLASDEAKYVTGTQLLVDGGLHCQVIAPPPA